MLTRTNCLMLRFSATICLLIFAAMPATAAEPKVYRCGPEGSQWFSQIPCEEDSEEVIVEDHTMFSETTETDPQAAATEDLSDPEVASQESAAKAQAFIDQLEKQRSEQLADIDGRITQLESRVTAPADGSGDASQPGGAVEASPEQQEVLQQLAALKRNRQTMVSEYEAMIQAARRRTATP